MKRFSFIAAVFCLAVMVLGTGCLVQSKGPIIGHMPDVQVMNVTGQYLLYSVGSEPSQAVIAQNFKGNVIAYKNTILESGKGTERVLLGLPLSEDAMVVQAEEEGTYLYYLVERTGEGFVQKDVDMKQYKKMAPELGFPPVVKDAQGGEAVNIDSLSLEQLWDFYTFMRHSPGMLAVSGRFVRQ